MNELFRKAAQKAAIVLGSAWIFVTAVTIVVIWALTGPLFGYSDTWQLVINTGTTIITFLMVFLIQNTQNRDTRAMHLKLDELIRAQQGARNSMMDLEDLSDEDLEKLHKEFLRICRDRGMYLNGRTDTKHAEEKEADPTI
jgi:low affinity Fe/Cu permease